MSDRKQEKFGWIGGWLGGFNWVIILSFVLLPLLMPLWMTGNRRWDDGENDN